ncbi:MAG: hypothetical protein ACHQC8_01275 [Solirubrobacterales bacterium]
MRALFMLCLLFIGGVAFAILLDFVADDAMPSRCRYSTLSRTAG